MKLHDLRPPAGSHTARTRVGRGIAAGKGKTAGRGTKGQKARAGGSIPPWFEGGQTPLHMRIPKLRGFRNPFKIDYEVVNVGDIAVLAERGAFEGGEPEGLKAKSGKAAPPTVNQDILRAVGLVRTLKKPLKILGAGDLSSPLFVVADAFTKSAVAKIEAAGGTVSVLEVPAETKPAIGVGEEGGRPTREPRTAAGRAAADRKVDARAARDTVAAEAAAEAAAVSEAKAAKPAKASKSKAPVAEAEAADDAPSVADGPDATTEAEAAEPADEAATPESDESASPLEAADTTADSDAPAGDIATETDAAEDGENA
jgi:large subunit ribosomal protein L15